MEMSKSSLKPVIGVVIRDPEDVYNLFKPMGYFEIEHLFVIYLNADSQIIQFAVPAVGTEYSVPVPIQEILTQAVEYSAKALIIIHNHPSYPEVGLDPSDSDLRVTQKLITTAETSGIEVLDHIIIGKNRYLSMRAEGKIAFNSVYPPRLKHAVFC